MQDTPKNTHTHTLTHPHNRYMNIVNTLRSHGNKQEMSKIGRGEEGRGEKRREGGREGRREREGERERRRREGGGRECVCMCLTHKSSLMYTEINRISKLIMVTDSLQ